METPILLSIEANIGAGKSTVLQKLMSVLDPKYATCIEEPIRDWQNFRDPTTNRSLLELYYSDPKKYALSLQTMIYSTLSRVLESTIESVRTSLYRPMIITERSLQSSNGIFAKMLLASGIMTPIEYQVYENCIVGAPPPLDVCIYLRTEPEVCYERVRDRNRQGEHRISLEYLRTCHAAHEAWIAAMPKSTHVYVIEVGTKTPEKILAEVLDILANLSHV